MTYRVYARPIDADDAWFEYDCFTREEALETLRRMRAVFREDAVCFGINEIADAMKEAA